MQNKPKELVVISGKGGTGKASIVASFAALAEAEQKIPLTPSLFDFGPLAADYDRWYDTPAGRANDRAQKGDVRQLLPLAAPNQTLLDIGCGTGHWSAFFAQMGYSVTGVDVAEAMVEAARTKVPHCTFQVADAARRTRHVELSVDGDFQMEFAEAMIFPDM